MTKEEDVMWGYNQAMKEVKKVIDEIREMLANATVKFHKGYGDIEDLREIIRKIDLELK